MKNEVISDNIELESSGEAEPSPEEQILFKGLHFQRWININMVRIFFVLWISVSLVALVPLLRPAVSVTEKRELHKFPSFSFSALFSGNYFSDIGLWYSDTFPLRDTLTELNGRMKYILGAGGEEIHGEVISAESGAEQLPDTQIRAEQGPEIQSEPEPEVVVEQLGAIAIIDNAGYEYYNFNKEAADIYISAVNRAADLLVGKARVFNTVIPTSIAVTLDQRTASRLNSSDQKAAMDYINSNLSQNAVSVDSYGILSQHKDEYIYFRTDHHWTALGAYYSYTKLMNAAGLVPADLSLFKEYIFGGFLGTFYATSKMSPKLGNTPDTVYAYEPPGLKYIHTYESGYEKDYRIVSNGDDLTSSEKYLTFVCGDHPLGVVVNEQIADNSSCLIIKESFGNPMISYFTQNYHTTFVIDYRKIRSVYGGNLITFVEEHAVNDVYFINNISATRSPKLTGKISDFVPQIQ
ncbi:MAG: hypothetical protein J5659_05240 [Clostridia bacterium]|nr:hypothetical protein [Clostridia bacterium]